jgi:metal-responsive CopG/Arc/MetJ family transcriptional regulator
MTTKQRVNVTLTDEALETLREIAERRGTSLSEVLRTAIGHERFLDEEVRAGNRIVVQSKDRSEQRELVITP